MESKRCIGIDCLKIVSMVMVVILHVLGQGGILQETKIINQNYELVYFLEIASLCAVNCYALISGYVGITAPYKFSRLISLWLNAMFYSVGITLIFAIINPEIITKTTVLLALFPTIYTQWWYFSAYVGVFLLMPFLNGLILQLNKQQAWKLIVILMIMFSIVPTFSQQDVFCAHNGYSFIWLAVCYVIGAIIKSQNLFENVTVKTAFVGYAICVLVTWGFMQGMRAVTMEHYGYEKWWDMLNPYISPTMLIAAIMLLIGFSKLQFGEKTTKTIKKVVPLTFGVYLMHVHKLVFEHVFRDAFREFAQLTWIWAVGAICLTVVFIFVICCLIEKLRSIIFTWLKVGYIAERIGNKLSAMWQRLCSSLL